MDVSATKILVDEMHDGLDSELEKRGYEAQSVKKLRSKGLPMQYDFSIFKYAERHGMILVTNDKKSCGGCEENYIRCIRSDSNTSHGEIIAALEKKLERL